MRALVFLALIVFGCIHAADAQSPTPTPPMSSVSVAPFENSNIFVEVSKKVIPSVVNISTLTRVSRPGGVELPEEFFRRFFEEFFGRGGRGSPFPLPFPDVFSNLVALGTGFIIDSEGIILTNNHVVEGAAEISISFTEVETDRPVKAKVIGRDPELDIALLKVEEKNRQFVPAVLGDSDAAQVGEYVMAIGNPFGQGHSVTHGIISQKGRVSPDFPLTTYIQTDAPINPGNSGGPLVNLKGEVIAVNNAIHAGAQGIGFAIPINVVKNVLPQLKEKGRVVRGYLGVAVQNLTPEIAERLGVKGLRAPFVVQTTEGSPGYEAGLRPYDVVTSFNDKPIVTANDLVSAVSAVPPGTTVSMVIRRNGKEKHLRVKLGERPSRDGAESRSEPEKERETPSKVGIRVENLNPEMAKQLGVPVSTKGLVVVSVVPGSPAAAAGLRPGDILVELNGKPIRDVRSFSAEIDKSKREILLKVHRPNPRGEDAYMAVIVRLAS